MIYRLAHNAAALPKINMFIDGMQITQGIQNSSNSVVLVQNRPTYVRIFVKSAGDPVPGVTARLYGSGTGVASGSLRPVNASGPITVRANPDRMSLDQSFIFELPWSWTQSDRSAPGRADQPLLLSAGARLRRQLLAGSMAHSSSSPRPGST